jgi:hypothetical protein
VNVRGVLGIEFIVCNWILVTKETVASDLCPIQVLTDLVRYCAIHVSCNILEVLTYVRIVICDIC